MNYNDIPKAAELHRRMEWVEGLIQQVSDVSEPQVQLTLFHTRGAPLKGGERIALSRAAILGELGVIRHTIQLEMIKLGIWDSVPVDDIRPRVTAPPAPEVPTPEPEDREPISDSEKWINHSIEDDVPF